MAQSSTVSGSQFFIALSDVNFLKQQGFSAFGKVVKGMSVVNRIKKVKTHNSGYHSNVPVSTIIIKKAVKL